MASKDQENPAGTRQTHSKPTQNQKVSYQIKHFCSIQLFEGQNFCWYLLVSLWSLLVPFTYPSIVRNMLTDAHIKIFNLSIYHLTKTINTWFIYTQRREQWIESKWSETKKTAIWHYWSKVWFSLSHEKEQLRIFNLKNRLFKERNLKTTKLYKREIRWQILFHYYHLVHPHFCFSLD